MQHHLHTRVIIIMLSYVIIILIIVHLKAKEGRG
jgi:hypothetical protein